MKTEKFLLPAFWACPLVNGDFSGLEESEEKQIEAWLSQQNLGFCLTVSESPEFTRWHDASDFVLACDCLEFTFEATQ